MCSSDLPEKCTTKHQLIVAKHRNGETGDIDLFWLGKFVRFMDAETLAEQQIANGDVDGGTGEGGDETELPDLSQGAEPDDGGDFIPPDEGEIPEASFDGESDIPIEDFEAENK